MPCDHRRLQSSVEAFEAGTRPLMRNGKQVRQYGARLADCITCPRNRPSTLTHPGDAALMEAFFVELERELHGTVRR